ncbi:transcriptional regulator with XRE-family HTH domain [Mucilaginibacter rubeus]|uniref:helix-turn-helix domain-containing protein n=1 Tax=Mucilaginibacter rubeus TaxID=2027860 RepID=UPI003396DF52
MGITDAQKESLMVLGNKLRAIRNDRGLTLKDLGYKINKDPQSISRVERGNINPTYLYLSDLCNGLEIDMHDLFKNL